MSKYILALDQGTTSSRAIIVNKAGQISAIAQKEFRQIFPKPGWVEHDPVDIWSSQRAVVSEASAKLGLENEDFAAIGITNQRETTIIWDRKTGKPVYNAIVWQDRRTSKYCDELRSAGHAAPIQAKTGLVLDAYFSATKIRWILENVDGVRERAEAGELAFGTVDSWLIWNLTKGELHLTDITNASRTMLFNIHELKWDKDLLELFEIPESLLPKVRSCSETYGKSSWGIPITGVAGDQQAGLFGQMAIEPGMVKNTYGTGCFVMANTGNKPVASKNNLLTTIAWQVDGKVSYALEGSIFIAGALVQWLRDGLDLIRNASEIEKLAKTESDNGGVYIVPAFTGLGAPHWDQDARGMMIGITRGTTRGHIARASLESICYQSRDVIEAMQSDAEIPIKELRVDGGASANNTLMQIQADVLNVDVIRPELQESTALGAAYFAGLAIDFWTLNELKNLWKEDRTFSPELNPEEREARYALWHKAVERSKNWAD
jgi:glycerol kinase